MISYHQIPGIRVVLTLTVKSGAARVAAGTVTAGLFLPAPVVTGHLSQLYSKTRRIQALIS